MADLKADLAASLHDAAEVLEDPDMERLLNTAAQDFNRHRPRTLLGTLTVEVDRMVYPAPADLYLFKSSLWGIAPVRRAKPWERAWPGTLPTVKAVDGADGRELHLVPAPSAHQVGTLGSEFRYYYFGKHMVDADASNTTILPGDRALLMLRAQAEAMRELAMRNITKPVQLRDGTNSAPKNMTPAAMFTALMREWESKMERVPA